MKFYTSNATGDSGLFLLGHWINQNFKFPFRVMSADIGIDAEIEMIDEEYHSEGLVLKVQVKATQKAITKNFSAYIDKAHLKYWDKLTVPVLFFKVDLTNNNIYYKHISSHDDITGTKSDDPDKLKIDFDIGNDLLTIDSLAIWRETFRLVEYHNLHNYFGQAIEILRSVITNVYDQDSYESQMLKVKEAQVIEQKLQSLKLLYPWKFGIKHSKVLNQITDTIASKSNDLKFSLMESNYN